MHLPTIIIGVALNAGCSILAGLNILFQTKYEEFTGTALQQESFLKFRIKDANGNISPEFLGLSNWKEGDTITMYFLNPAYYIVPPSTTPGQTIEGLWSAVVGMGVALLILSAFQEKKGQMVFGNILRIAAAIQSCHRSSRGCGKQ